MTTLGDSDYRAGASSYGGIAKLSPDGKKAVIVLRKGNLEQNTNEYSLVIWDTKTVFTSPSPNVALTMSSSSNREGITEIRWFRNDILTFLGESPGEHREVYAFNIRTHELRKLTNHPTDVNSYSISATGDEIAFIGQVPSESLWDDNARHNGVVVSRQSIPDLITGRRAGERDDRNGELYLQRSDGERRLNVHDSPFVSRPFLSPDGKYIVATVQIPVSEESQILKRYPDPAFDIFRRRSTQRIAPPASILARYQLVNTESGSSRVLLDSPSEPPDIEVVWLPDSQSVVLSNVLLPFEGVVGIKWANKRQPRFTVEMNVSTGKLTTIGSGHLRALAWDSEVRRLVCELTPAHKQSVGTERSVELRRVYFAKNGGQWQQSTGSPREVGEVQFIIREGMNDPPKIYAHQPVTNQEKLLLDLNPQFQALRFGRVEEIEWCWSKAHNIKAGLYYPPDYVPGKRYPLVIQTHDWDPHQFWMDGPWTTAYAAQALAAKDIIVLQVQDEYISIPYGRTGQRDEVEKAVAIYASAVDHLYRKGMVDRNRVGIIGFSHTCFYVKYALTHSNVTFAAASVTEGEDGGYLQFMTNENKFVDAYSMYGGRPFGKILTEWIRLSPGFNLHKTSTPLRITTLSPENLMLDWEWFQGLTLLSRPVDMVLIQDGTHVLQKPWDRIVSQQGNVDWFDFWLNGREDPDSSKREQYKRWRELRELQRKAKLRRMRFN
ncbi:MAG TPA: hypothetical protein VJP02_20540 [Candidatus Sulfotelmatobacter sp.]|nr:hypothetical protein [Candidatus Sulfotelmatobacter sp.]